MTISVQKAESIVDRCWCGCANLYQASHPEYLICKQCGTAILRDKSSSHQTAVLDEQSHLYGDSYWDQHQTRNGLPPLRSRARTDLADRAQHWIRYLLKYRLPPGRSLEIGCAHGGLVKLMQLAGFEATGVEMSPKVIEQARDWFGVNVLKGPLGVECTIQEQADILIMFDVIEHLDDPLSVMASITSQLNQAGVLVIQTPRHASTRSHNWRMYIPPEHTYLFTLQSLTELLRRLGFIYVAEEPSVFQDDMFLFASREPLQTNTDEQVVSKLSGSPEGRMLLTMQDLYRKVCSLKIRDPLKELGAKPLGKAFFRALRVAICRRLGLQGRG